MENKQFTAARNGTLLVAQEQQAHAIDFAYRGSPVAKRIWDVTSKFHKGARTKNIIEEFRSAKGLEIVPFYNKKFMLSGKYKRAFKIKLNKKYWVVKFGTSVGREYRWYKVVRKFKRGKIAKIYWATDYCCLQRCAESGARIYHEGFKEFRRDVREVAKDIRPSNCGYFNGKLKCFDIGPPVGKARRDL